MNRRPGSRKPFEHVGFIACILLMFGNVAALAEDTPPTDCDTYAASKVDPQRKGEGVSLDKVDSAKAIPACLDALSHDPNSQRFQFQLGRAYEKSGDNDQAVAWYRKAAEQGFGLAQNNLGSMYLKGLGVGKDNALGLSWIRKAAEQGHANAQFNVALMYDHGVGVSKDEAQAFAWLRKAAEQGVDAASSLVGFDYELGKGVAKDVVQAAIWSRKAAEHGFSQAQYNLGLMYERGVGVPKDDLESFSWTRKAAEQGFAQAQYNLGLMYDHGAGVAKDDAQAFNWMCRAAEQGNLPGQVSLGGRYLKGIGVKQNDIAAYMWFNLSAAQGEKAAAMIRDTLARSMTPAQIAEAQRLTREWKPSSKAECEVAADAFTCKGTLTDQRRVGISLGDCDLNSLPRSDIKKITDVCGQPSGVDEDTNKKICFVRGVVSQKIKSNGNTVIERMLAVKAGAQ